MFGIGKIFLKEIYCVFTYFCIVVTGLHLRNNEESRMPTDGVGGESGLHRLHRHCYDPEYARMEAWLDEHPDFVQDYFLR